MIINFYRFFDQTFLLYKCRDLSELKGLVKESVEIYNHMRPHLSLGMKTPEEIHKKATPRTEVAKLKTVNVF